MEKNVSLTSSKHEPENPFIKNTLVVGLATALVYLLNTLKDLVAASYFGTTDLMDAFIFALIICWICAKVDYFSYSTF